MSNENKGPQGKVFDVTSLIQKPKERPAAEPQQEAAPQAPPSVGSKEYAAIATECIRSHQDISEVMAFASQVAFSLESGQISAEVAVKELATVLCHTIAVMSVRVASLEEELESAPGFGAEEAMQDLAEAVGIALNELRKPNFSKPGVINILERALRDAEDYLDGDEDEDEDEDEG